MKIFKMLLIIMFFSFNVLAVQPIKKDNPAPYDGWIFTQEEELQLRIKDIECLFDRTKGEFIFQLAEEYKKAYQEADEALQKKQKYSTWSKIGYFMLGAGTILLGAWSMGQVAK